MKFVFKIYLNFKNNYKKKISTRKNHMQIRFNINSNIFRNKIKYKKINKSQSTK